jgi:hypothetical protein
MKRVIRLVVIAGLAFAFGNAFAQEEAESATRTVPAAEECKPSDPCKDIEPGAASKEPAEALEDPADVETSKAHERWLEEVWNSP